MANLNTRLVVAVMVCFVLIALTTGAKDPVPRKHKKYNPGHVAANGKQQAPHKMGPQHRSPRQIGEQRQYYPCISCFKIGSREICTAPFCPDNYQCDRATKRCHKKPNVRGTPVEEDDQPAAPAAPAPSQN